MTAVFLKTYHQPSAKKPKGSFPSLDDDDENLRLYPRSKMIQDDIALAVKTWRRQFLGGIVHGSNNSHRTKAARDDDDDDDDNDRKALIAPAHRDRNAAAAP
mmetsp:Transcript_7229/g.18159  ORF Transcript_7229/g.18159 Transcript_7229/m.18159 type:complete len:102 (+) Transcript_7229:400-705(+)